MTDAQQPATAAPAVGQKRKAEDDAAEDKGAAPAADTRPAPVGFAGYASAARGFGAGASGTGFGGFASVPLSSGGFGGFAKSAGAGEAPQALGGPSVFGAKAFGGGSTGKEASDEEEGGDGDGDDGDDEAGAAAAEPKAVVTLPEAPRVTGEEGEDTVFSGPATLFAFEAPSTGRAPTWRERGKGEVRLNIGRDGTRARLVMRSAGNLRLILNANVFAGMRLAVMDGGNGVTFACANAADEPAAGGAPAEAQDAQAPPAMGGSANGSSETPALPAVHTFALRLRAADAEHKVRELKEAIEAAIQQTGGDKGGGEGPSAV